MRIINYISAAVLIIIPAISVSEDVVVPSEVGTEILMTTIYHSGGEIKEVFIKKGDNVRKEELSVEGNGEMLIGVSIYDGKATWNISQDGREKVEGFNIYPWVLSQDEKKGIKWAEWNGEVARLVEKDGNRKYIDPDRDIILFEENMGNKTYYRDYTLVEGFGLIPEVIEKVNDKGYTVFKTELKRVEQLKQLSNDLFDPDMVVIDIESPTSHPPD